MVRHATLKGAPKLTHPFKSTVFSQPKLTPTKANQNQRYYVTRPCGGASKSTHLFKSTLRTVNSPHMQVNAQLSTHLSRLSAQSTDPFKSTLHTRGLGRHATLRGAPKKVRRLSWKGSLIKREERERLSGLLRCTRSVSRTRKISPHFLLYKRCSPNFKAREREK
jgi:hypothetical protein